MTLISCIRDKLLNRQVGPQTSLTAAVQLKLTVNMGTHSELICSVPLPLAVFQKLFLQEGLSQKALWFLRVFSATFSLRYVHGSVNPDCSPAASSSAPAVSNERQTRVQLLFHIFGVKVSMLTHKVQAETPTQLNYRPSLTSVMV